MAESLLQDGIKCLIDLKESFNDIKYMLKVIINYFIIKKFSETTKDYSK